MAMEPHRMAAYRVIQDGGGLRFRFFCEASGAALCTTGIIPARPLDRALDYAWETEGRAHFNLCHRCGRWVADVMYNADTLECVDCSPWEEEPAFCPQCGARVASRDEFCGRCGARLRYGEGDAAYEGLGARAR